MIQIDLSGKTAIVTGAGQGLGACCAQLLADAGTNVVINYFSDLEGINRERAEQTAFKIGKRAWLNTPEIFQRGKLIGLDSAPKYDYISADLAPAYQKDQITDYTRELVYIRPEIIIIHDRLDSKANSTKKFLLHVVNQPAMGGMQLDEHWQSYP